MDIEGERESGRGEKRDGKEGWRDGGRGWRGGKVIQRSYVKEAEERNKLHKECSQDCTLIRQSSFAGYFAFVERDPRSFEMFVLVSFDYGLTVKDKTLQLTVSTVQRNHLYTRTTCLQRPL